MPIPLPASTQQMIDDKTLRQKNAGLIGTRGNSQRLDALHSTKLKPWMLAYAHWLASEPKWPNAGMRRSKLAELTKLRATATLHRIVWARADFQAYYAEICQGPLEEARAKFKADLPAYVEGHKKAFEAVLKQEDWKAVKDYTIPALERVWPRRSDGQVPNTNITITLSAGQQASLDIPLPVIEAEIVPDPSPPSE